MCIRDSLFFCSATLDGTGQRNKNAVKTGAIVVDLDCGAVGHKKESPFPDIEAALAHLRGLPCLPSFIWKTGHGVQAAFLLDQPVLFSDQHRAALYEQVRKQLFAATKSDWTSARSQLFRVPGCMNIKKDCPPVRSEMVEYHPERRYDLATLEAAFP